jgi:hypothetical protein
LSGYRLAGRCVGEGAEGDTGLTDVAGIQVDAIVPTLKGKEKSSLPVELEQFMAQAGDFYYCPKVNLADLLEPAFMNSYVRQGESVDEWLNGFGS